MTQLEIIEELRQDYIPHKNTLYKFDGFYGGYIDIKHLEFLFYRHDGSEEWKQLFLLFIQLAEAFNEQRKKGFE